MFDDIRPYNAEEFPEAMQRIAASTSFPLLASYVYPDEPLEDVRHRIASYKNVHDFQTQTMFRVNERVIEESITEFTCSGIERLSRDKSYLYVSNHRDIMLDASLLQYFLLTANDAIENYLIQDFDSRYPSKVVGQGACVWNECLLMPTGFGSEEAPSIVYVLDLKTRKLRNILDLSKTLTNEMEDIDFYQGDAYIQTNGRGIVKLDYK